MPGALTPNPSAGEYGDECARVGTTVRLPARRQRRRAPLRPMTRDDPAGQGKTGSGSPAALGTVCLMRKNYFDERIAENYESKWPELFEPAAVDPVVSFLARLAGSGPKAWSPTTTGWKTARSTSCQRRSATSGPPNSTSWPGRPE